MTFTDMMADFKRELAQVINKHGVDNICNTPDFILASHISDVLLSLERTVSARDSWFGVDPRQTFIPESKDSTEIHPWGGRLADQNPLLGKDVR